MKRLFLILLFAGLIAVMLAACAGGGVRTRIFYHGNYGYGGWWGHRTYIDRRPIILPPDYGDRDAVNLPVYPDTGQPEFEATPLPAEPFMDMDMGMPEMIDMGMDW